MFRPEDLLAHAAWVRGVAYALVRDAATADGGSAYAAENQASATAAPRNHGEILRIMTCIPQRCARMKRKRTRQPILNCKFLCR